MPEFQVVFGRKEQPKEEWTVHRKWDYSGSEPKVIDTWGNPQEANIVCKELNTGFKNAGEYDYAAMLRRLPDPVDYLARETARPDYQAFEVQGEEYHCAMLMPNANISYYNTLHDAYDNRRSTMKVGRYLRKYTQKTDTEIGEICARYGVEFGDAVVRFAKTRDEIREVYLNGPSSCMADDADCYGTGIHPSEVYASGDFEVAYIMRDERITARSVVIPSKKKWICTYGDTTRLRAALEELGYSRCNTGKEAYGLRLLRLEGNGRIALPFFDFAGGVEFDEDKDYLKITGDGQSGGEAGYLEGDLSYPCSDDDWDDDWDY